MAASKLTLAPGLRSLRRVPVTFIFNGKKFSERFVREVAVALGEAAGVEPSFWKKPSPYKPLTPRAVGQIAERSRAVVAGPGDCGHGSACSLLDAIQFEALGMPIAWLDGPRRVPHIQRRSGRYAIDYGASKWIERSAAGLDTREPAVRARLQVGFEKFGFHRALRLAGARPGDAVEVGTLLVDELWEYPEGSYPHIPDGIRDYPYIETEQGARRVLPALEAKRVVPEIRRRLGTARARA